MRFLSSSVGRKILMAATGIMMFFFIIIHVVGNSTIYLGWLNAYAEHLHALPPLVWAFRFVMLALFVLHVFYGIQLTLENNSAKPVTYAVKNHRKATLASKNMIWTGIIIAIFLVYHLLHFTLHVTNPDISNGVDSLGRPDVFHMVVYSFQKVGIAAIYVVAMIALALHLSHGVQSFFQTLGWNTQNLMPSLVKAAAIIATVLFIGYVSIPLVILVGILKG
jgi:succinate dehydrogenase / fumarate reductase cytochrome b subunit